MHKNRSSTLDAIKLATAAIVFGPLGWFIVSCCLPTDSRANVIPRSARVRVTLSDKFDTFLFYLPHVLIISTVVAVVAFIVKSKSVGPRRMLF
jgi:hypothetical protein